MHLSLVIPLWCPICYAKHCQTSLALDFLQGLIHRVWITDNMWFFIQRADLIHLFIELSAIVCDGLVWWHELSRTFSMDTRFVLGAKGACSLANGLVRCYFQKLMPSSELICLLMNVRRGAPIQPMPVSSTGIGMVSQCVLFLIFAMPNYLRADNIPPLCSPTQYSLF